jgi:hypothetical protein
MTPSSILSSSETMNDTACSPRTTKRRTPATTGVSFSPVVVACHILHRFDYTSQEIKSCWYSPVDIRTMKKDNKQLILLLSSSDIIGDCLRGLEGKTHRGAQQKRQNKLRVREAVIYEQRRQQQIIIMNGGRGVRDPEAIADACYDATEHCQAMAYMLGLRDEFEVKAMFMLFPQQQQQQQQQQQEETSSQEVAEEVEVENVRKEENNSSTIIMDPAGYCYKPRAYERSPFLVSTVAPRRSE